MKTILVLAGVVLALYLLLRFLSRTAWMEPSKPWDLPYEEIASVPDDEVEFFIVEQVSDRMHDGWDPEEIRDYPEGPLLVFSTWLVETEVHNGGFDQYFSNTDGDLADVAIAGFRRLDAPRAASLVEEALEVRNDRQALDRLDDRFYELEEPISESRIRYIRENPGRFEAGPRAGAD